MKICSVCYRCYEDRAVHCADKSHQALLETHDGDIEMVSGYALEVLERSSAREAVYKARHIASDRSCIIKRIRASADRVKDFLRDAEIASSLFHPNVVDIYETGQLASGDLFVVTEDAPGQILRERMAGGVPDLMTAIRIATEAASAIHTLHLKSLVHRAIRPENIVLAHDDQGELLVRIKEPDLGGVAQHAIVSDKFTIDSARDQLRYFAPEQCNNDAISIKTDVYSLGIVLYEMLAGRPPFDSPKASGLIEMHRHRRPAEIKIDDFELRMLVTHTVMQSLSKHASDRQSSANAFARQLRHVEQLSTHVSTPPPAGIVPPEPLRSSPRIHISDAGFLAEASLATFSAEPVFDGEEVSMHSIEAKAAPRADPIIQKLPMPNVRADARPSLRQRLSRLKRDRKRPQNVSMVAEPGKVHREQIEDDLPSMEAVMAARSEMRDTVASPILEPVRMPVESMRPAPARTVVASAVAGVSTVFATSHHEPDEITVPPLRGNPIRINIDAPKPPPKRTPVRSIVPSPADESSAFPTLFGSEATKTVPAGTGSLLLSSFYGTEQAQLGWPVQKLTLAAGIVAAAAAIFVFSGLTVSRYAARASVDSRSQPGPAPASVQQQAVVTAPQPSVHKKPLKYFDSPQPKPNSNTAAESKPEASTKSLKTQPFAASKTNKKDGTRADASHRDKVAVKPEMTKREKPDRSITSASNKPTATTRPRIVKVQRP